MGDYGTVVRSSDGGATWQAVVTPVSNNLTGGAGGGILESPLLVTIAADTDSLTNPGTLSYALAAASGYQSIYGYVPGNKVVLRGANPLPHLQSGVRFVGGSCTAKLTIDGMRIKTGLVLDGGNRLVGLRLLCILILDISLNSLEYCCASFKLHSKSIARTDPLS